MRRSALPEALFKILGNRTALHILFWAFLFSTLVLLESGTPSLAAKALHAGVFLSFCAAATYVHFFLLGRYLNRRRYTLYICGLLLTLGVLGFLLNWISSALSGSGGSIPGMIFSLTFFLGFTTALHYARGSSSWSLGIPSQSASFRGLQSIDPMWSLHALQQMSGLETLLASKQPSPLPGSMIFSRRRDMPQTLMTSRHRTCLL